MTIGPYVQLKLLQAIKADVKRNGVMTQSRNSVIIPAMVGAKLLIHTGNSYKPIIIREEMVGFRVGHLAPSTKPVANLTPKAQRVYYNRKDKKPEPINRK